ncbi:MAG: glycosyltransferase [Bacteroidetes bacterium]|nr:glycosyltransferase [Bacteroidota bacterium]
MIQTRTEPTNGSGTHTSAPNTTRKRVLFLTYRFPYPLVGGDRVKSYHLLRHLSTIADVDLISLDEWDTGHGEALEHLRSFCHSVKVVPFRKRAAALRIVRSLASSTPIEAAYYNDPLMQRAVDEALICNHYDLAIGFFIRTACYLKYATGVTKMLIAEDSRLLADERATKHFSASPEYVVRRIDALRLRRYEPALMKQFAVTTFVATPDEERVKGVDPAVRTAILTNGVDLERYAFNDGERENAILFAGHLGIYHNRRMVERVLTSIYPAIRAERPDVKLWIAGKDPTDDLVKLIAATDGAELFRDPADLAPFYAKAKVFVHPQDVGAGIQNKLLEAMASGCPVVTTPIGASGIDGIINGMHVMVSETDEEFVHNGLRLLGDAKESAWLARNSRTLIERRYSWDQVFSSFDDIIEGIAPNFFTVGVPKREALS